MSAVVATATLLAESGYGGPDEWKFVLAGWGLIAGGIGAYTLAIVRKGRKLSKELGADERRWMS
jgi:hypothetical protein